MLKWFLPLLALVWASLASGSTTNYYASPTGLTNNTGAIGSPWNLQTAYNNLRADTTIWLFSGNYPTNLTEYGGQSGHGGTPTAPAIIQALTNYGPVLGCNGVRGLDIFSSDYTYIMGLTVVSNLTDGIKLQGANCVVSNCIVSGNGNGISAGQGIASNSSGSKSNTIVHCVIEGNGLFPVAVGTAFGHGLYISHNGNVIDGCLVRSNWGFGIQYYSGAVTANQTDTVIKNCIVDGNTNSYGVVIYSADEVGGLTPGTNWVINCTILDGMALSWGTTLASNCIILPSPLIDPTRPVNTNSVRVPTFVSDYCFGTNTIVNSGGHNYITNLSRASLWPNLASLGQYWLSTNHPARGKGLRSVTANTDFWGNWQAQKYDIGAVEYDMDLAADTRSLIGTAAAPSISSDAYLYVDHIPGHRRYEWGQSTVGVPGGIPTSYTQFCNATISIPGTNIVAIADDVIDDAPAIQAALNLCPTNAFVLLPVGSYICKTNLTLKGNYRILRGEGSNTILRVRFTNTALPFFNFGVYSEQGTSRTNMIAVTKGMTNTVWDSVNNMGALFPGTNGVMKIWENDAGTNGGYAAVQDASGSADPVHYSPSASYKTNAAAPLMRQMFRITGTNTGNIVYFQPPCMFDFQAGKALSQYLYLESLNYSGLENFMIDCSSNCSVAIQMSQGMGSWIKGVETYMPNNYHVYVQYSTLGEIRDCYFHEAVNYAPSQGVGVIMYSHVSGYNIYNNVFRKSYPAIETDLGVSGCVIGYNYFLEPQGGLADIDCHGPHSANMLVEGNIGYGVLLDGYFGSAEKWTFYRNWLAGNATTFGARKVVNLDHFSRNINVVNNFIGNPYTNWVSEIQSNGWNNAYCALYRLGYPNMGNDSYTGTNTTLQATNYPFMDFFVKTSLWLHANVEYSTVGNYTTNYSPLLTNRSFRASYFYDWNTNQSTSPPWWNTNAQWPPIGINAIPIQTNLNSAAYVYSAAPPASGGSGGGSPVRSAWRLIFGN